MGCGKTKIVIDTACQAHLDGKINGMLVVAPNAVHPNWGRNELPKHMWDEVPYECVTWQTKRAKTKKFGYELQNAMSCDGMAILTVNYEAMRTKSYCAMIEKFLTSRKCMIVCDESHRIKNPNAKTTKALLRVSKHAVMRRICTGTVFSNSVFDLFSQFGFLDKNILGFNSYYTFRNTFGIFVKQYGAYGSYDQLIGFKDVERLNELIAPYSSRILKKDIVEIDFPDKIYMKRYIQMSPKMRKAYDDMKSQLFFELMDGDIVEVNIALTKLQKLQQIVSGFVTVDGSDDVRWIEEENVRAKALIDILQDIDGKVIVWAKFVPDFKAITQEMDKHKMNYVTYYGQTSDEDRIEAEKRFADDPDCKYFIGNPSVCGLGLNMISSHNTVYYNNSFKYDDRLQCEDRNHRIGQKYDVNYFDLVMDGSIDEEIIDALITKEDFANKVNGDQLREWLR